MRVDLLRWRVFCEGVVVAAFMWEWQARDYVEKLAHFSSMDGRRTLYSRERPKTKTKHRRGRR